MSMIRADLFDSVVQHATNGSAIPLEAFLARFSVQHCLERTTVDLALDDLRHFGLIEISRDTVALTGLGKRLVA